MCAISFLVSGLAFAEIEPAEINVGDSDCGMADESSGVFRFVNANSRQVSVNSANGNIHVSCSADLDPTITGRSVIYNFDNTQEKCGAFGFEPTDDWHQVTSRSGQAKLICHFKTE